MHPAIKDQLESYGRYYSLLKKPRGLQWRPTLGVTKVSFADPFQLQLMCYNPLSIEFGTYKTVKVRFWSCLEGQIP